MKMSYGVILILSIFFTSSFGQDVKLFKAKEPFNSRMNGSIKSIKKNSNDSTLVAGKFEYESDSGKWIVVPLQVRVRGNFRLKNCYFPPLKLKFSKNDVASTIFEGNKALKLVVPCQTSVDRNSLIRKEYLCYQFYQILSPYYFRTRLTNLTLTEISQKKPRTFELLCFFVEDNSMVAKRSDGKIVDNLKVDPSAFEEKQSVRNDYFQYMIGNADWSAVLQHNSNSMYVKNRYIPLSYDFDMSGFVSAGYARDNPPSLGTGDPRERVYRGFCKSPSVMEEVRKEFLEKESAIHAVIDEHAPFFKKYELDDMHTYLDQFFRILKDDKDFKVSIIGRCRTK